MDRLISEGRVLRVVRHIIRWMDCNDDKSEVIKLVEDRIKAIPPAEPKWIPVSERLPEADGRYLCTYEDDIYENCVDFGSYENGEWYVDKVIAWMPLPKPYEPQERSEE